MKARFNSEKGRKTMLNDIYFADNNGKLVTNRELARMAFVINGEYINSEDLDAIRAYATTCKGIQKEVNPSIKICLKNGEKVRAIMIYRDRHPGVGLKEAKDVIDEMEEKMRLGILK